ncbi:MAG: sigma-70 family RNA polymerase sigma factor [Bacteroidales bacterium]|nr:sigma-70 family RNA polymerase sigma factor [Bacteroidales bacterium]
MRNFSDEKLIEIYKTTTGSQKLKALNCLYLRYSDALKNYFFFALNYDTEKAKDFVHDTFMKIIESPEKFDTKLKFKPWIYKVASNLCKNDYRKLEIIKKHKQELENRVIQYTEIYENQRILSEAIKKLPQDKRALIVLRFKINLSIKEIAEIYECPEGTIKSRLFYATKELSKLYKN